MASIQPGRSFGNDPRTPAAWSKEPGTFMNDGAGIYHEVAPGFYVVSQNPNECRVAAPYGAGRNAKSRTKKKVTKRGHSSGAGLLSQGRIGPKYHQRWSA